VAKGNAPFLLLHRLVFKTSAASLYLPNHHDSFGESRPTSYSRQRPTDVVDTASEHRSFLTAHPWLRLCETPLSKGHYAVRGCEQMVGMVGLAPTKVFRPAVLQTAPIAAPVTRPISVIKGTDDPISTDTRPTQANRLLECLRL
jgi:hypothetical protein